MHAAAQEHINELRRQADVARLVRGERPERKRRIRLSFITRARRQRKHIEAKPAFTR